MTVFKYASPDLVERAARVTTANEAQQQARERLKLFM